MLAKMACSHDGADARADRPPQDSAQRYALQSRKAVLSGRPYVSCELHKSQVQT